MCNRTLIAVLAFWLSAGAAAGQQAPAADTKTPSRSNEKGVRVLLIGIDALCMPVLESLAEAGRIPRMAALMKAGGAGPLASYWPLRTMQVWTSVVTGKRPGRHGIWDHVTNSYYNPPEYRTEERKVYTSADRRSKALWQLLGEKGISSLTVGWPTTWPAEKVPGAVIVAPKVLYGDDRRVTIKGSLWRHVTGAVQPARLEGAVRSLIIEPQQIETSELSALADVPAPGSPLRELPRIEDYIYALRWNLARARSVEAVTLALAEKTRPQVVLAYFQCPDSLGHRFWIFSKSLPEIRQRLRQFKVPTEHAEALQKHFGQVIARCHADVDTRVGRLVEALAGPETLIMLVSDHGFGDGPKHHPFKAEPWGGIHWSDGAILARAPGLEPGGRIQKASALDVTPTILHHLGLAVADDMQGVVLEAIFPAAGRKARPVKRIPTYEEKPQLASPYPDGFPPKPKSFVW